MRTTRKRAFALVAGMSTIALLASACGGSDDGAEEPAGDGGETTDEEITLTISTFNEWGYDTLLDQYMEEHPNITIEHNKFATSNEARDQFNTSLAAGSGLADVVGVEVDWMPEIMEYSDQFVDLTSDSVEGRWQDWKVGQATTPDGKLVGYGTDIGPEAIAYRADLFEAAGLPADREVATAKYWAAAGGQRVVRAAQHLHGGMGVDRDYPLHRYFLTAKEIELQLGGTTRQLLSLRRLIAAEAV